MRLLLSLSLILVAVKPTQAQCDFQFCGELDNIPDLTARVNPDDPVAEQKSCALLYDEVAASIYNTLECEKSVKLFENVCCPEVATTRQCFLCGDTEEKFNAEKTFAGFGSCGDFDKTLAILPVGEHCNNTKSSAPMNVQSFCECPDAVAPNTCKVCEDNQEVNASATFPGLGGLFDLTCGDGAELAIHVANDTECAEFATPNITAACCMDKASSGTYLSISSLATALIVGLAFTKN